MDTRLNKSDYKLLAIYIALVPLLLNSYFYFRRDALLREYLVDFSVGFAFIFALIYIQMHWLIPQYIFKQKKYVRFILLSLIFIAGLGMIGNTVGFWSANSDWTKFPKALNLFVNGLFAGIAAIGLPLALLLIKKYYESQLSFVKVRKQNELRLLRSQLDPHFLFNNLNTLDALIDSNVNRAKEYINRLSLIYRYLIKTKDDEIIPLSEELDFAKNYIFLIKTRFEDDYEFEIVKHTNLGNQYVVPGAIQTTLENVVKHNKALDNKTVKCIITINKERLIVENTISKTDSSQESFGVGLENLKARYKLLSNENVQIVRSETAFKISIPILTLNNESQNL